MEHQEQEDDFTTIRYSIIDDAIARVTMARPEVRNAQNIQMSYEIDEAFTRAAMDPRVKVVILAADGPHWNSGHDMKSGADDFTRPPPARTVAAGGRGQPGVEGPMAFEEEVYLGLCRRWHELPKPTIAQCQGVTVAGGLMLAMVCDLIVASEDATFADPTVGMGVNGGEWFAHPWQFGARKAKELLFTGDAITAEHALRVGFVNHVVPREELEDFTLDLARRIATRSSFALKLAKYSVNQALEAQGFWSAIQAAFSLQHLGHANNRERFGMAIDPAGIPKEITKGDPDWVKRRFG